MSDFNRSGLNEPNVFETNLRTVNVFDSCLYDTRAQDLKSLLDLYGGANAAYSLRQISATGRGSVTETEATYLMPVVRVRRDSDNAEKSFNSDEVKAGHLLSWVTATSGTANGYVSKWYDQSGNNLDATQVTAGSQPQVVNAGVLVLDGNGNAALDFDGSDDTLSVTFPTLTAHSIFLVSEANSDDVQIGSSGTNYFSNKISSVLTVTNSGAQDKFTPTISSGTFISTYIRNGTTSGSAYNNGTSLSSTAAGITTQNAAYVNIGGFSAFVNNGTITELILYGSDQSSNRTGIESNIATAYGITI